MQPNSPASKPQPQPAYLIRRAALEDLDALVHLRLELIREVASEGGQPAAQVVEATRAYLEKKIPTGEFVGWVAELNGQIVGTSGLVFFERPPHTANLTGIEAYIMNMYTLPEQRGHGISTDLMEAILEYLRQTQVRRIWLHASEAARPIYARMGFVPNHTEMEMILKG